jgi:regulatory protein
MKQSTMDLALKHLTYRDRTCYEIKRYLEINGVSEDEALLCIQRLIENNLVNDENYCDKYIRYSMGKKRGPLRIERDLRKKGVSEAIIKLKLDENFERDDELQYAMDYAKKTVTDEGMGLEKKDIERIGRKLSNQGYHSYIIYDVLNKLGLTLDE